MPDPIDPADPGRQLKPFDDELDAPSVPGLSADAARLRRWRLLLGDPAQQECQGFQLSDHDAQMDAALAALYDAGDNRKAGLGGSAPRVARWLGDVRTYFPSRVVQVLQRDAIDRLGLRRLLLEPELLEAAQPDVHLVSTLVALNRAIPEKSRDTARLVVRKVVDELEAKLASPLRQAVRGALDRANRTSRPRAADIDWPRTIGANLKHYQPDYETVVPERLIGYARKVNRVQRDIILCIDQSGSMAASVVYASVFGAVLASLRSVRTRLVVFDTAVVDLTDQLDDPVEILFGVQLGGGTDINGALAYCQGLVTTPSDTILILISDLYEGGIKEQMLRRVNDLLAGGVQVIVLLALSDEGRPAFDKDHAAALAALGAPAFACTPEAFPDLMATAITKGDLGAFLDRNDLSTPVTAE
jgi:Mg-chelatase subunit ChlD